MNREVPARYQRRLGVDPAEAVQQHHATPVRPTRTTLRFRHRSGTTYGSSGCDFLRRANGKQLSTIFEDVVVASFLVAGV